MKSIVGSQISNLKSLVAILAVVAILASGFAVAAPPAGPTALKATADSVAIRTARFIKFNAAGTLAKEANAAGDKVAGVSLAAFDANGDGAYAPAGLTVTLAIGAAVAKGDLLVSDSAGAGVPWSADANANQRIAARALETQADPNFTIQAEVIGGSIIQQNAARTGTFQVTGNTVLGGVVTVTDPNIAKWNVTTSLAAKILTVSDPNIAKWTVTGSLASNILTVTDPNIAKWNVTTSLNANILTLTDPNITPIPYTSAGNMLAGADANVALGIVFAVSVVEANNQVTQYTVPAGKKLRVLDALAVKVGAGSDANDAVQTVTISSTGSAITNAIPLGIVDAARKAPSTINLTNRDIAAGGLLRITAANADGGTSACRVIMMCCWVAP